MGRTIQPRSTEILPDIIKPGTILQAKTMLVRVVGTSKKDRYDQPYVRLAYPEHTYEGWWHPATIGNTLFTRDDLQVMGYTIHKTKSRRTK